MAKIDEKYHVLLQDILKNGFRYEDSNRKNIYRIQIPSYQIKHDFIDGFPAITTKKLYWKGVVGELLWFLRGDTNIKYLVDHGINIWNKDAYNHYCKLMNEYKVIKPISFDNFNNNIKNGDLHKSTLKRQYGYNYGDLGRIYGAQWRDWHGKHDQISNLIKGLRKNPMGTQHIVTAWSPAELDNMALPPCHWAFEILVKPLTVDQRYKIQGVSDYYKYMMQKDYSDQRCNEELDMGNHPKYSFVLKWHQRSVDTFLG